MDYCGMGGIKHSSEELHRNFSHWMNATGRPMHLELCRGYSLHPIPDYVAEVANSWRVAGDNWDYWPVRPSPVRRPSVTRPSVRAFLWLSPLPNQSG